ncbi:MAG: hypothetical protein R3B06_15325 [Kofleriaceae bacterium]
MTWQRQPEVLLTPDPTRPWMAETVAEVALVRGPDGDYYLFFTGFAVGGAEMAIGVARAATITGPYQVRPKPIITAADVDFAAGQVLAPAVLIDATGAHLWFMGIDAQGSYQIGRADVPPA